MPTDAELPLRDIHAAAAASWWPLSALSWVLLAVLVIGLTWLALRTLKAWLRRRRRRRLLADLEQLDHAFAEHGDRGRLARDLSQWLRRLLLHRGGPELKPTVALTGAQWHAALAKPFANDQRLAKAASELAEQPWRAQPTLDERAAFALARAWVGHLSRSGHV